MTSSLPAGLRERKKAKTRAAIREHAMRLFDEQGYAATTVDQIAEAAEVSPSTFFRYFPTKEDVVLTDDYDEPILDAFRAQPPEVHPAEAMIRAIREVFAAVTPAEWKAEQRRQRLVYLEPELQSRAMQQYVTMIGLVAAVIAERAGLPADDFSARVSAGALIGASLASLPPGMAGGPDFSDLNRLERGLKLLQEGLPLTGG
jgi:AcrR family transcriptional regulator